MPEESTPVPDRPAPLPSRRVLFSSLKLAALAAIVLMLWIPLQLVQSLVAERSARSEGVRREVAASWGSPQTLAAPELLLTYRCLVAELERPRCVDEHTVQVRQGPSEVRWEGAMTPEIRSRGIYEVVLWTANLQASVTFDAPAPRWSDQGRDYVLEGARLSLPSLEAAGFARGEVDWGGSSTPLVDPAPQGVELAQPIRVDLDVELRGSGRLGFPVTGAETTSVALTSTWHSPSFGGARLPQSRVVTTDGFEARWSARDPGLLAESTAAADSRAPGAAFWVELVVPVDGYQLTTRATKYGLLFVLLTFATFFVLEVVGEKRLHPVQYFLVGSALCLFYLLLLSLSEHVGFGLSYFLAGGATVTLISLYAAALGDGWAWCGSLLAALSLLFGYLYVLLQLEDFALLMGSLGLFVALAFVMWTTRNFDWFRFENRPLGSRP